MYENKKTHSKRLSPCRWNMMPSWGKMFLPNNFAVWKKMLSFAPEKNESNEHKAE